MLSIATFSELLLVETPSLADDGACVLYMGTFLMRHANVFL